MMILQSVAPDCAHFNLTKQGMEYALQMIRNRIDQRALELANVLRPGWRNFSYRVELTQDSLTNLLILEIDGEELEIRLEF